MSLLRCEISIATCQRQCVEIEYKLDTLAFRCFDDSLPPYLFHLFQTSVTPLVLSGLVRRNLSLSQELDYTETFGQ